MRNKSMLEAVVVVTLRLALRFRLVQLEGNAFRAGRNQIVIILAEFDVFEIVEPCWTH